MRHVLLLLSLLVAPLVASHAATRDYAARIPIEADTQENRAAALRAALAEVLLRVSGRSAPEHLLDQAHAWVLHFGLDRDEVGLGLRAGFDGRAIENALRAEGLPVWGAFEGDLMTLGVIVAGLQQPGHYAELMKRLENLAEIRSVSLASLRGDRLELRVSTAAGAYAIDEALRGFARPESPDPTTGALRYRLQ